MHVDFAGFAHDCLEMKQELSDGFQTSYNPKTMILDRLDDTNRSSL